jgi:tRNA uracil 4-sulfurtransferase
VLTWKESLNYVFKGGNLAFCMIIVIHYSEIGTKGKNRGLFENALVSNIKRALGGAVQGVYRRYGLVFCDGFSGNVEDTKKILEKIPGIANFAFGEKIELEYEAIVDRVLKYTASKNFESFKISCRRSNKNFPKNSEEIHVDLGSMIVEGQGKKVDLVNPELEVFLEIGEKESFLYSAKSAGIGGLPSGVSARVLASLSGGIDSPVAAYMMMRRGCKVSFVHFFNKTALGEASLDKVKELVKILGKIQLEGRLYVVNFGDLQKEIITKVPAEYRMIVYRRYMMRILDKIGELEDVKGIVTGDNVGQVASQTLENLDLIWGASNQGIYAPLIGINKEEIIKMARFIETYRTSVLPYEDCCSFMIAKHPETMGERGKVEKFEKEIDDSLIEKAVTESYFSKN